MKNESVIFSAIQFLLTIALFSGGAILLSIHYTPGIRIKLIDWITREETSFLFAGAILIALGFFLSLCFFVMQRHQYIRLKSHFIDERYVKAAISTFWKEELKNFPKPTDIYFSNKKIEIVTKTPIQKKELKEIETQLGKFLANQMGYRKEFFISLRN